MDRRMVLCSHSLLELMPTDTVGCQDYDASVVAHDESCACRQSVGHSATGVS
jgi:hypothetical protein